jgi:hypothetical protein
MKKWLVSLAAVAAVVLAAPRVSARDAAVYASAQAGLQTRGDTGLQLGFEVGGHWSLLDGYVSYMGFGSGRSISRGILGVRGTLGTGRLRLMLRAGAGAVHESSGALTSPLGPTPMPTILSRTGVVVRGGGSLDVRLYGGAWLGAGGDVEGFSFLNSGSLGFTTRGVNALGILKLTLEYAF